MHEQPDSLGHLVCERRRALAAHDLGEEEVGGDDEVQEDPTDVDEHRDAVAPARRLRRVAQPRVRHRQPTDRVHLTAH